MSGFKLEISDDGSDHSSDCATSTVHLDKIFIFSKLDIVHSSFVRSFGQSYAIPISRILNFSSVPLNGPPVN